MLSEQNVRTRRMHPNAILFVCYPLERKKKLSVEKSRKRVIFRMSRPRIYGAHFYRKFWHYSNWIAAACRRAYLLNKPACIMFALSDRTVYFQSNRRKKKIKKRNPAMRLLLSYHPTDVKNLKHSHESFTCRKC